MVYILKSVLRSSERTPFPMRLPGSTDNVRLSAQALRGVSALGLISLTITACATSRITGAYVAHGPSFAEMLRLTQTEHGQITGVLSSIELNAQGELKSDRASVAGTGDGNQLTFTFNPGLFGNNVAGTIKGSTIEIQMMAPKGDLVTSIFTRSTPEEFKIYADQLKSKAASILLSSNLSGQAKEMRQSVQSAEQWMADAETHAQKIPGVKDYYRRLEDEMGALVERERSTRNATARTQISARVIQGNVAGIQTDVRVDAMWDSTIANSGHELEVAFGNYPPTCGTRKELLKRGAISQAVEDWETACRQARAERTKLDPIFKRIIEQRADLKSFQTAAQAHKQALVDEASRIQ